MQPHELYQTNVLSSPIHETLANGITQQRWKSFDVFAYERMGGSHLLVGLNNDPGAAQNIHVDTGFGPNVTLHDYTGHRADVVTGGDGSVSITIPQNIKGLGYVSYSRAGQDRPLPTSSHRVTQDIEGALDLDILFAINGKTITAGRIWCQTNTPISAVLDFDRTGWSAASKVEVSVLFPDQTVSTQTVTLDSPANPVLETTTKAEGFYALQVAAAGLPATNLNPAYKLSVTYAATQTLAMAQPVAQLAANSAAVGQWAPKFNLENVGPGVRPIPDR